MWEYLATTWRTCQQTMEGLEEISWPKVYHSAIFTNGTTRTCVEHGKMYTTPTRHVHTIELCFQLFPQNLSLIPIHLKIKTS